MCQPLDGRHSIMTGNNRAGWISVIQRKITAIHLVSDQYFPLNCFVAGQTTGIRDRIGRYRLFCRGPPISSFEHDLASVFFHASALQQSAQRHTGPFRIADCAELPLCSFQLRGREMTAYVEEVRRSEKRVKLIERSLQIFRLLLSSDQADRRGLTSSS